SGVSLRPDSRFVGGILPSTGQRRDDGAGCLPPGAPGRGGGKGWAWQPFWVQWSGGNFGGLGPVGGAVWVNDGGGATASQGPRPARTCSSTRPSSIAPAEVVLPRVALGASRPMIPAPWRSRWSPLLDID